MLISCKRGFLGSNFLRNIKSNPAAMPIQYVAASAGLIKIKSSGQKRRLDKFAAALMS